MGIQETLWRLVIRHPFVPFFRHWEGGSAGEVDLRHSSHRENKGRKVLPAVP